ncbi:MAG TPA: DUF4337 domain-containing protein [Hyphomicrobiaceae bacterium]|nr:DUF4337 domain-containing protein [Hyphomicrobiaceae bacterium]
MLDELSRELASDRQRARDKLIGVYIGVLAVVLALCALGGSNASKNATNANIDATNTWAFFQAKNMRRTSYMLAVDELEADLAAHPSMPAEAQRLIEARIAAYREQIRTLTTDAVRREGLDELFEKGKALEQVRDLALQRDPYFDWGQALLQIAIVLASVAIVAGGQLLIWVSAALGLLGALLTANGFLLIVELPFLS